MQVTIDKAGRLVIPKKIRERAHIKPGIKLDVRVENGVIEIEPAPVKARLVRDGSFLVLVRPPGTPPLTDELIERVREEMELERAGLSLLTPDRDADVPT
jgi:AbrB family looped-hinge helix DNA binding protein